MVHLFENPIIDWGGIILHMLLYVGTFYLLLNVVTYVQRNMI